MLWMAQDEDKILTQIDTSHLSDDFAEKVTQMVQNHLQNPHAVQTPPWLDIYSEENSISPAVKKPEFLDVRASQASNETNNAATRSNLELQPGEAVPLFTDAFIRRTELSIQIKNSLKQTIINAAKAKNTSPTAIIESSLRNTFPDSWESDLEKQFHVSLLPEGILTAARGKPTKGVSEHYTEIEFSLSDKLLAYLVGNINDRDVYISLDKALEQALEHDFHGVKPHTIDQETHFDHN